MASKMKIKCALVNKMTEQIDIVVYHGNCFDGTGGAWAVWKKHPQALLVPAWHGNPNPLQFLPPLSDKNVCIVDFCYPAAVLLELATLAHSVLVLDHHKSAAADVAQVQQNMPNNLRVVFDMTRSGAQIAWDYFHNSPRPWIIDVIGDRDLWKFSLPYTRTLTEVLSARDYCKTVANMETIANISLEEALARFQSEGELILSLNKKQAQEYSQRAVLTRLTLPAGKYLVGVYPNVKPKHVSDEVGNLVAANGVPDWLDATGVAYLPVDFSVGYTYDLSKDSWYLSARSTSAALKRGIDLSVIMNAFNGGGHPSASGGILVGAATLKETFVYLAEVPPDVPVAPLASPAGVSAAPASMEVDSAK